MKTMLIRSALRSSAARGALALALSLAAVPAARAELLAGDFGNAFSTIAQLNPGSGYAQEFTVGAGLWNVTAARFFLGNQDPFYPVTPTVQLRDASGAGGGPGAAVLGTFSLSAGDIPPFIFGVNNFAPVTALANGSFSVNAGSYWLCIANAGALGGFGAGVTTASPLVQGSPFGNILNVNGMALSFDGGLSYGAPDSTGSAMLVEFYAQLVPEPASGTLLLTALGVFLLRKRK